MDVKKQKKNKVGKYCGILIAISIIVGFSQMDSNPNAGTFLITIVPLILIGIILINIIIRNKDKINATDKKFQANFYSNPIMADNPSEWIRKADNFYINPDDSQVIIGKELLNYNDIIDYELLSDESIISKTNSSSAITRTLLFGAFIGGTTAKRKNINYCRNLKIKVTINNIQKPTAYINFIRNGKVNKNSIYYKNIVNKVNECMSILKIITEKSKKE